MNFETRKMIQVESTVTGNQTDFSSEQLIVSVRRSLVSQEVQLYEKEKKALRRVTEEIDETGKFKSNSKASNAST